MNVIIKNHCGLKEQFLLKLPSDEVIAEVNEHINNGRYARAVVTVFIKGNFIREIEHNDMFDINAELIISDSNIYRTVL
ncbi:MAG: hypothetical protein ABH883_07155 [Candidatus Omnitrophota bacterium]